MFRGELFIKGKSENNRNVHKLVMIKDDIFIQQNITQPLKGMKCGIINFGNNEKKSDTKGHMLYVFIYMKCLLQANIKRQ